MHVQTHYFVYLRSRIWQIVWQGHSTVWPVCDILSRKQQNASININYTYSVCNSSPPFLFFFPTSLHLYSFQNKHICHSEIINSNCSFAKTKEILHEAFISYTVLTCVPKQQLEPVSYTLVSLHMGDPSARARFVISRELPWYRPVSSILI